MISRLGVHFQSAKYGEFKGWKPDWCEFPSMSTCFTYEYYYLLQGIFGMNVGKIDPGTLSTLAQYIAITLPLTIMMAWIIIAFQSKYLMPGLFWLHFLEFLREYSTACLGKVPVTITTDYLASSSRDFSTNTKHVQGGH